MNWLHRHWLSVVLLMTLCTFVFWAVGYIANGLYSYHFDLTSCWSGMGAIATAAVAGFGKWWADSKYNTEDGSFKPKGD